MSRDDSSGEECLPAAACRVEARSLMTSVVETASKFLGFFGNVFFRVVRGLFLGYFLDIIGYHRSYDFWELFQGLSDFRLFI